MRSKKRKSLVGWTWNGFKLEFNRDYPQEIILKTNIYKSKYGMSDKKDIVKVRITIQELEDER